MLKRKSEGRGREDRPPHDGKGVECTDRKAQKTQGTIATRVAVYRGSSNYVVRNGLKSSKQAQRGSRSCSCHCVKAQSLRAIAEHGNSAHCRKCSALACEEHVKSRSAWFVQPSSTWPSSHSPCAILVWLEAR